MPAIHRHIRVAAGLLLAWTSFCGLPASADVTVSIDASTLNELLSASALREVTVALTEERSLTVRMEELEVTGLEPAAGNQQGFIATSLRLRVPELGLAFSVAPRISLNVVRDDAGSVLELRFEKVELPLPLAGPLNIAGMLPPLRYPADNLWLLAGASGDVHVRSRLVRIRMGREVIRFEFSIDVAPPQ